MDLLQHRGSLYRREDTNNHEQAMKETILQEADRLVDGDRQWAYDHPYDNCVRIGKMWGLILDIDPIPPEKVALMMCGLKIVREMHRHKRDNLVDLAGYAKVADMVEREKLVRKKGLTLDKVLPSLHL